MAHGPDDALVRFAPQDSGSGPIMVTVGGARGLSYPPVCDVNALAQDHRWRNLDDVRHAKSVIGDVLVIGGAGVIAASNHGRHSSETGTLVGAGMILAGIISKAGASADTRYMEFAPQRVYLVPLQLGEPTNVDLRVADGPEPGLVLPWLRPGTREAPRAVYLRLHGRDSVQPAWLSARERRHGNDWSGVRPGDWPWILGGNDVSTPGAQSLRAYQVGGYLREMTEGELLDLYEAEGIALESGAVPVGEQLDDSAWRHVLEGGRALFLPAPDSVGYKRLMYSDHAPYTSRSEILRNALTEIRVGAAPRE